MATKRPFGNEPKAVLQIKDGKVVKEFQSLCDATKSIRQKNPNANISKISECANGKSKSAYGYVWKFAK